MKFNEFLHEALLKTDFLTPIDKDKLIQLIKENCKNTNYDEPILRGMHDKGDYLQVDATKIKRTSKSGSNVHTICLDYHFKKLGYPLRSESLICATYDLKRMTRGYGTVYVILPYDNVDIGVVNNADIFNAEHERLGLEIAQLMEGVADLLKMKSSDIRIDDLSKLKAIIDDTDLTITDNRYDGLWDNAKRLVDDLGRDKLSDKDAVYKYILELYNPRNFMFNKVKPNKIDDYTDTELWFTGNALAIKESLWDELKKDL